jgi:hypothetical protein
MWKCRCVCVALALAVTAGPVAAAEPPGPAQEVALTPLDTITPCVFFASRLFQEKCPYVRQPSPPQPAFGSADVLANMEKLTRARDLYRLAEYYRRAGQCDTAATYYEEAHLVCPTCRYGLQAMERLSQLDAERPFVVSKNYSFMSIEEALQHGINQVQRDAEQTVAVSKKLDLEEVIQRCGFCADVSFGEATRFQIEIPLGVIRIRVEYNGNAAVRVP